MQKQTINSVPIKPLHIFGELALLAQSDRLGNRLSNRKMKPAKYVGDFVQFTILPLEFCNSWRDEGKGDIDQSASDRLR